MTLTRRHLLMGALCAATAATLHAPQVRALSRPNYGGTLRLALPLRLRSLDPHDPHDLTASLLGQAVFETLFARTPDGRPYPTLATQLPRVVGGSVHVELRPGLRFSSGKTFGAKEAVAAIKRSQKLSPALRSLGVPTLSRAQFLEFSLPAGNVETIAATLAERRAAILPLDFDPSAPIGCGALRVERLGAELRLVRNVLASRGGSFLDQVIIESASIVECLRAFESRRSDLGFLGAGLHEMRRDVVPFRLPPMGLVLLQPGRRLDPFARPGVLHESLARLPEAPFSSLGVARPRAPARKWSGPKVELLVSREEPWLLTLAEELAATWTSPGTPVKVRTLSSQELSDHRSSRDYDLLLSALALGGLRPEQVTGELFALDGKSAPRGGRVVTPDQAARQLGLGILGELMPHGSLTREVVDLIAGDSLDLAQAQRSKFAI